MTEYARNDVTRQSLMQQIVAEQGAILWIAVGCSVFVVVVALVAFVLWSRVRRRERLRQEQQQQQAAAAEKALQHNLPLISSIQAQLIGSGYSAIKSTARSPSPCHTIVSSASDDVPRSSYYEGYPEPGRIFRSSTVTLPDSYPSLSGVSLSGVAESGPSSSFDYDPQQSRSEDDDIQVSNGKLTFEAWYNSETKQLLVHIVGIKSLPGRGLNNCPRDPFVRVYLLPNEETYFQTKEKRKTLSPKFHETFTFDVPEEDLSNRTIRISAYDIDKRRVRHCLGHVFLPLEGEDLTKKLTVTRELDVVQTLPSMHGNIMISLSCNPFSNRIRATICRVANLPPAFTDGVIGVHVRVQLNHGQKTMRIKSSQTQRLDKEIVFNESFTFGIAGRYFDSCSLEFTVIANTSTGDQDRMMGQVVLGPFLYARGNQLLHWQEMMAKPRHVITYWHPLQHRRLKPYKPLKKSRSTDD